MELSGELEKFKEKLEGPGALRAFLLQHLNLLLNTEMLLQLN